MASPASSKRRGSCDNLQDPQYDVEVSMPKFGFTLAIALFAATAPAQVSEVPQPLSTGIVLDTSGTMAVNMNLVRGLVAELAKSAGPADEFALIQASDRPVILSGFAGKSDLDSRVEFVTAKGRSALLDAVYLGSQFMRTGRNTRKILLVISDGGDRSRYTEAEIRESLAQTRVRVFTVAAMRSEPGEPELTFLRQLAEGSQGRFSNVSRSSDLAALAGELSSAMRAGQ
jgi:Ca-activated chloride channel family protein